MEEVVIGTLLVEGHAVENSENCGENDTAFSVRRKFIFDNFYDCVLALQKVVFVAIAGRRNFVKSSFVNCDSSCGERLALVGEQLIIIGGELRLRGHLPGVWKFLRCFGMA